MPGSTEAEPISHLRRFYWTALTFAGCSASLGSIRPSRPFNMLTEKETNVSHWFLEGTELLHNDCSRTDVLRDSNGTQRLAASGTQFLSFRVSVLANDVKTKARGTKGMSSDLTLEVRWTSKGSCLLFPVTSWVVFGQTWGHQFSVQ